MKLDAAAKIAGAAIAITAIASLTTCAVNDQNEFQKSVRVCIEAGGQVVHGNCIRSR